jgi:hypothetical protein
MAGDRSFSATFAGKKIVAQQNKPLVDLLTIVDPFSVFLVYDLVALPT